MTPSTPTAPARHPASVPRRPPASPLSSLDDGTLVRRALDLHLVAGELPRGTLARMASLLGVDRATVSRASAGGNVRRLTAEARKTLEAHVADPAGHPLPPGSTLRGRPRADAPPLDPRRRKSRGGARAGDVPRAGSTRVPLWLTAEEEEAVRELAAERRVVPGRVVAEALKAYAQRPDEAPPASPEGARRCHWMTGAGPIAVLDDAVGARGRREHARAAVLRLLAGGKEKNG